MTDGASLDVFRTMNAGFVQAMYEQYLRDPTSVDEDWRLLFENGGSGLEPIAVPVPSVPPAAEPTATPGAAPMRGAAARLAANMAESLGVPTATSFRDVPVTTLDGRRKALNAALAPTRISYTHLIAWALVQAARRYPVMTHAFAELDGTPHRVEPESVSLGLAVDVEKKDGSRALVVPVIRHADRMDFASFRAEYESLVERARANRLLPDDYQGATMTLTNPGTIGTVASVPRLMAGQGSIIATGAIRDVGGARVMTVSSTYDHRVIQGAESGMFLAAVDSLLQGEDGFYDHVFSSLGIDAARPAETVRAAPAIPKVAAAPPPAGALTADDAKHVAAATRLVRAYRNFGYLAAHLDPLGSVPTGDPALDPLALDLTPEILRRIPAEPLRVFVAGRTAADVLPALTETYCGTIAYEVEHLASHVERVWLRQLIEQGKHRVPLTAESRRALFGSLVEVEALERFLHRAYLGQKRFSIEGLEIVVPMLDLLIELAADDGARDVVVGMAHRGRLNVLAHVLNLPYEAILGEFEGGQGSRPEGGTGDVKYHHGAEGVYTTRSGKRVTVTLPSNPSHLEAVNPVVEGRTRADQTRRDLPGAVVDPNCAIPVLLHGDAAFAGQGVVAETFNLARLRGYSTGGTIHVICNNQVGFTTDPRDARSTDYASDLAKGFDVPIVHVNADDPEACLAAMRLAMMYRREFHGDFVIDVVGYRRHGHNEGDEPAYTQPAMYETIRQHPTVRERYQQHLVEAGVMTDVDAEARSEAAYQRLAQIQQVVKARRRETGHGEELRITRQELPEPATAVPADRLLALNEQLLASPEGFAVNPKLKRQLERRRETVGPEGGIEWAHAESLALGSLLLEGTPVRLTGQDTERGTFSQRHLVLHATDGGRWVPIQNLPEAKAAFELHNSPLSEYACLGFEYGYAAAAPEALVLWEAQFGDFANGAEIIIDQFIISGLAKWGITSRLTVLLPHGYEGQGPEHSSARVERYVALGAEGNIRVANCTTPAQYFHLLRRQAKHTEMRPLVVMTPKSLLRLPAATSRLDELTGGRFEAVLDDTRAATRAGGITRLVLCSGKVYYDIVTSEERAAAKHVAVGRVEMLYPFPAEQVGALARRYPALREIVWVQEEPRNMGARKFLMPDLRRLAPEGVNVLEVSRPERASPAEGYPAAHAAEQARIVRAALEGGAA